MRHGTENENDDNRIPCKQEGGASLLSPVAEFSAWNSVAPSGEKTSGNVLVKLTELSPRGDGTLCRLRIPLRRASRYSLSARIYGIVAKRVCLSHLRSKNLFAHRNTWRVNRLEDLFALHRNAELFALLVTAKSTSRY